VRKVASAALLALAVAVASCGTREDNSLGLGFVEELGAQKAVRYSAVAADSSADFQSAEQASNAGDSPSVTVGSQAGTFVRSLLQFDISVLPPAGTVVDSAWVLLTYSDGIATLDSTFSVGVHRVTESWGETEVPDPFPSYLAAAESTSLSLASSSDSVRVPATALAQFWVDQPDSNLGLALVPQDTVAVLLEYTSRNSPRPPQLVVHWTSNGADTSVTAGVAIDTSPLSKLPSFAPLSGQPGRLTVGRGFPSASLLRFPLPEIGERATVNRAVLTLHIDPSLSEYNTWTLRFQRVVELPWAADSTALDVIAYGLTPLPAGADSVRIELGSLVAELAREGNLGVLMRAHENRPDCDYVRFHGPDTSVPELAPKLQIWYTPGEDEEDAP
jgi:hypothetical protein